MTCETAAPILVQIGRNQLLEVKSRGSALEHATGCQRCGVRLANERMLSAGLGLLADEWAEFEPPAHIAAALLAAHAEQSVPERAAVAQSHSSRPKWAVAAAIGAVAFGLVALRNPLRSHALPLPAESTASISPELLAALGSMPDNNFQNEGNAQFVPVPFADPIGPGERLELQHVELTRSALLAMGLPSAAPSLADPDEALPADLVVGEDGAPRAVRVFDDEQGD